ncbi:hypothetical protein [Pseudonocardia sp. H11422]|uniref:hypothetical protein n=1 Tax=Pseudonocardia sp. H11422 TaxID=2835866 RepID=UPI001BDCF1D7|nr:hypothetical protein [Pseudonocardia sp. H11422]
MATVMRIRRGQSGGGGAPAPSRGLRGPAGRVVAGRVTPARGTAERGGSDRSPDREPGGGWPDLVEPNSEDP